MSELFNPHGPFATSIAHLDAEHAQLHLEAKQLAVMLARGEDVEAAITALTHYLSLLEAHFRREETFFDAFEPYRAETHRKEHEMLVLKLKLFIKNVEDRSGMENWTDFVILDDLLLKHVILFDLELRA